MKQFFWKDKSGRGFTNTFDEQELIDAMQCEVSWNDESIGEWLECAMPEIGDRWENAANEVTRIK